MKSLETPLHKVRGLGASHSGTGHFWRERVTAAALIPLSLWFLYAALGLAVAPVLGLAPCIAGLLLAAMVSFVVYLPLTALALNGGQRIGADDPAPVLTRTAHGVLLVLWTATVWGAALLVTLR